MAWQSLGIFGQVNTQTFHFLKHFNASLKKRYYRKKKKNCAQISQESKKKKKKRKSSLWNIRINKNYFTMPSLQTSACITPWLIYITPTSTWIKIVKSDSFYDADSVTLLATEIALRAHGAHLWHFTYGPVHTIYIQICRCFVRIFFFFFCH